MYKCLIIGCGNIGALYDIDSDSVSSYARAFHLDPEIEFEVYDTDRDARDRVGHRYGVPALPNLDAGGFPKYDIIAVCSPTPTHHAYLEPMLQRGPGLVICEKPVDVERNRLRALAKLYQSSKSKVMVNLFRRFQPKFIEFKKQLKELLARDSCTNIVVSYQRGFHNNAIHAIDLLEFLFDASIDFDDACITHAVADEFESDPTLSLGCTWDRINLQFIGLAQVEFSHFEIAICCKRNAVKIKSTGNVIEFWRAANADTRPYPRLEFDRREDEVLKNYMQNVVAHAKKMLARPTRDCDNFLQSIEISNRILKLQGY